MAIPCENHLQFFTAVCLNWLHLLEHDDCKQILIRALQYRVKTRQVAIAGYVIMPNHFHIIWRINGDINPSDYQRDFLKITAKQIIDHLSRIDPVKHQKLFVNLRDRKYQVWRRNAMSIDLFTEYFILQKLHYIHNNPCQPHWELANHPCDYKYSSAAYYQYQNDPFDLLTHYKEI